MNSNDIINNYLANVGSSDGSAVRKVVKNARARENLRRPPCTTTEESSIAYISGKVYDFLPIPDIIRDNIQRALWTVEAYFKFLFTTWNALIKTVFLEPSRIIFNPFSTFIGVISFLVVQLIAFSAVLLVWLFRLFRILPLLDKIRAKYGGGNSVVNMGDPEMFGRYNETIEKAKRIFSSGFECPESVMEPGLDDSTYEENGKRVRYFNIDVAKALCLFSAAMYERDEDLSAEAILENRGNPYPNTDKHREAEKPIDNIAAAWGLEFEGISDLNSFGGAFCGLWWDPRSNWIVVSFKGTTPYNGVEWLKDLTFTRVNSNAFVYGAIHQGFHEMLFPNQRHKVAYSPYGNIVQALIDASKHLKKNNNKETVNVYITGHSLGSAIAAVFYARAIKAPKDFGPYIKIRNAYLYGTPRVGDADFLAGYYSDINIPFENQQMLYRVIDRFDVVCRIPLGEADTPEQRDYLDKRSIFNYGHIGDGLLIDGHPQPVLFGNSFATDAEIRTVQDDNHYGYNTDSTNGNHTTTSSSSSNSKNGVQANDSANWWQFNPITVLGFFLPALIADHAPPKYLQRLDQLKPNFTGAPSIPVAPLVAREVKHG